MEKDSSQIAVSPLPESRSGSAVRANCLCTSFRFWLAMRLCALLTHKHAHARVSLSLSSGATASQRRLFSDWATEQQSGTCRIFSAAVRARVRERPFARHRRRELSPEARRLRTRTLATQALESSERSSPAAFLKGEEVKIIRHRVCSDQHDLPSQEKWRSCPPCVCARGSSFFSCTSSRYIAGPRRAVQPCGALVA